VWLFTLDGFYSVVADRDDPSRLLVRTRDADDAQRMAERLGVSAVSTPASEGYDYAYRMFVARETFAKALADEALGITYDNFKNAVHDRRGSKRAAIYSRVWSLLYDAFGRGAG
jgi:hypothetical protein